MLADDMSDVDPSDATQSSVQLAHTRMQSMESVAGIDWESMRQTADTPSNKFSYTSPKPGDR